jgi:hypothetical protein
MQQNQGNEALAQSRTYGIDVANKARQMRYLDRGLEKTPDGVRGENDQVEGPLYQEARKSTAKNGGFISPISLLPLTADCPRQVSVLD